MSSESPQQSPSLQPPDAHPDGESVQGRPVGVHWGTLALGVGTGVAIVLLVLAVGVAAGLVVLGTGPPRSGPSSLAGQPTASPIFSQALSPAGTIPIAEQASPEMEAAPELPLAIELTPADVPWAPGDTVVIAGASGANLRPYPIADDDLAASSVGLPQGMEVQIVSTFRLRMRDGQWWYVRIPESALSAAQMFGWLREDLLQPTAAATP